jgi:hypothetical protein
MSDDMRDRLSAEFAEYDAATMALSNAFGFLDDPAEWKDSPGEHAEVWADASAAAGRVVDAAEALADGARRIARDLDPDD